ncbi:hypothetical protein [Taibaiella chishuiensis]|uniref:VCBS repeat protein n=1 Tax=Taibaiella chishuiensis TaxID=1434707 RepID=A0A2P8D332_9BACT|nr:hypothetical protein [Taibaiella chishuiensis]PSK91623.1 hypothetical protein B0I18_105208 [Taibaiella chishuiensis]
MENSGKAKGSSTSIVVITVLALVLAAGALFLWQYRNTTPEPVVAPVAAAIPVPEKTTSAPAPPVEPQEPEGEEEESPYSEYRVVANSIVLPGAKLLFGDKVFADERKSGSTRKIILLKNPYRYPGGTAYQVNPGSLIEEYRFEEYKNNFSLAPFSELSPAVKSVLLAENYSDGNKYSITQNAERAGVCLATGDFDGDGMKDIAVLMDNNEKQVCRLLILCTNKATRQPYVAFAENYADRMKVHGFRKRASVFMNTQHFVPAPQDGIIVRGEDVVLAVIYDSSLQKFKTYYQE